jgi:hypothetical protein
MDCGKGADASEAARPVLSTPSTSQPGIIGLLVEVMAGKAEIEN